jgi:hypothetical protein
MLQTLVTFLLITASPILAQVPTCTITSPPPGAAQAGEVTITFSGDDPLRFEPSPFVFWFVTSTFEFSSDGGASWSQATPAASSPTANPDVDRPVPFSGAVFVWDAVADGVGLAGSQNVDLRATVTAPGGGVAGRFERHPLTPRFGEANGKAMALGDLDGDGDLDALLGVSSAIPVEATVWLNDGTGVFGPHPSVPSFHAGDLNQAVALGDLDGDGDLDALVGNQFGDETVCLNDGTGVFAPHPVAPSFPGGQLTRAVALGDLDGDGDLDALVCNGAYSPTVSTDPDTIWLNDGTGGFSPHPVTPTIRTAPSAAVALGDLDGDGDLDAMIGEYRAGGSMVWLNDGSGGLSAHPAPLPSAGDLVGSIALGDLDRDGDLDAVLGRGGDVERVWLNDGTGTFSLHPMSFGFVGDHSWGLALGDLDADGDLDVVLGDYVGPSTVWLNNGLGTFTAHPTIPDLGEGSLVALALGDLDGDLDPDLVLANGAGQCETVWKNDGTGALTPPPVPGFGGGKGDAFATGDLDGDGDLDALIGSTGEQPETVWVNDGTGSFAPHPTAPSFGGSETGAVALGDLDADGDLDAIVGNHGRWLTGAPDTVWLNNGNGAFSPHPVTPSLGNEATLGLALGDLDADGDLDLISVDWGSSCAVWRNDGIGSFSPHPSAPTFAAGQPRTVTLGDLDADGDLDAIVGNFASIVPAAGSPDTVWLNDGSGIFLPHPLTPSFGNGCTTDIALEDLDADGDLDAVVGNADAPETVWQNDGTGGFSAHPTTPSLGVGDGWNSYLDTGDIDGDGDADLLVATDGIPVAVWVNDGVGHLTPFSMCPILSAYVRAGIVLEDLDRDQDVDALVVGTSSDRNSVWLNTTFPLRSGSCQVDLVVVDCLACGDCNLNAVGPDILDALEVAMISAGTIAPSASRGSCCDVDGSLTLSVLDALRIAQVAAGLPVTLACP